MFLLCCSIHLSRASLSADAVADAVLALLQDGQYAADMQRLQRVTRVFGRSAEYAARLLELYAHDGTAFLRPAAAFGFVRGDEAAVVLTIAAVFVYAVYRLLRRCGCCCCGRTGKSGPREGVDVSSSSSSASKQKQS